MFVDFRIGEIHTFLVYSCTNLRCPDVSEVSPERIVKVAENPEFQGSDSSSECPDELYNLTKLAEVAAAAGQILENRHLSVTPNSTSDEEPSYTYTHKLFDKSSRAPRTHVLKVSGHINLQNCMTYFQICKTFSLIFYFLSNTLYKTPKNSKLISKC